MTPTKSSFHRLLAAFLLIQHPYLSPCLFPGNLGYLADEAPTSYSRTRLGCTQ